MKISQITRRGIADALLLEEINWAGRLEEAEFLGRLFNLAELPSHDRRFSDAASDIYQHRVNNLYDWSDDWVFYDPRFNILNADDNMFLQFLCETVHPVVRSESTEVERLVNLYNSHLSNDGFQLVEKSRISNRPIYAARYVGTTAIPGISIVKESLGGMDLSYVAQQITRMEAAVHADTDLAIGTAKELIETCCKTILRERNIKFEETLDLPKLVKETVKQLKLTPDDINRKAKGVATIKRLLSNLATITHGVAELRNSYGTGHGKAAGNKGLSPRHAKLAVGAASTLAVFLVETHLSRSD